MLGHNRDPWPEGAPTLTRGGAPAAPETSERQLLGWGSGEPLAAVGRERHGGINGSSGDRRGQIQEAEPPKTQFPMGLRVQWDTRTRTAPGAPGLVSTEMPGQCLNCPLGKRVTPQPTSVTVSIEAPSLPNEKQEAKSDGVPVALQGS